MPNTIHVSVLKNVLVHVSVFGSKDAALLLPFNFNLKKKSRNSRKSVFVFYMISNLKVQEVEDQFF